MLKSNKLPDQKETLINKLYFIDNNLLNLQFERPTRFPAAKEAAVVLLDMISGWLGEDK